MDPVDLDWEQAYDDGVTPWDLRGATQPLRVLAAEGLFSRLGLPRTPRVALPGCGRGHDLKVFAELGMEVTGFDVADRAVTEARGLLRLNRVSADVLCRDVLGLSPEFEGAFDLVYDYTFLCALKPQLRAAYARALVAILRPEALLLILAFPMMTRREPLQGPPFRVLETDLVRIFTPGFRLVETFEAKGSPARRAGYERWYLWRCRSRVACS